MCMVTSCHEGRSPRRGKLIETPRFSNSVCSAICRRTAVAHCVARRLSLPVPAPQVGGTSAKDAGFQGFGIKHKEEAMTSLRLWHAAWAVLLATSQAALAQAWPERTIQAIVPFAAGAANDIVGRIVLEQVSKQVNQPIVVENRPGAGGTIGVTAVAKAPPNGHTILVHSSSFSTAYSPRSSRSARRRRCWSPRRRKASRPSLI